ncbi:MAG: nucleotidyltransferase family protein [Gemmatimonadetes bacterium]|nr:nucleotidyltransferase family protein [Gemmatimonadota bacterium]
MSDAPVADALRLRHWALAVLASPAGAPPAPAAEPRAWELFLHAERCALPLQRALAAGGISLPPEAGDVLPRRALVELQRALSARGVLVRCGAALSSGGWRGIVLKGGVAALSGAPLDVADVDILVHEPDADEIGATLRAGGLQPHGVDVPAGAAGFSHLTPLAAEGSVVLELHYAVPELENEDPWADAVETGTPGLLRLAPAAHLWHVLSHAVDAHPERRGAVRDLLVTRDALAACSPAERARVEARARASGTRRALLATLDAAAALLEGHVPGDEMRDAAALRVLMAGEERMRRLSTPAQLSLLSVAFAACAGAREYAALWGRTPPRGVLAPIRGVGWINRLPGPLAQTVRSGWRAALTVASTPPALAMVRRARRLARAAE